MSDARRSRIEQLAEAALDGRASASRLRTRRVIDAVDTTHVRIGARVLVNFSSNDYLGLTHHPQVCAAIAASAAKASGSGAAALVAGRGASHEAAERAIAHWKGVDDAVLLPSGYQANAAAVQAVAGIVEASGRSPRFLVDKLVHASLLDAIRATSAELRVFPHNGLAKLERLVSDRDASRLDVVVTESIFSMDGDEAPLGEILDLRRRYGFPLVLDDAHASGVLGPGGAGLASELARSGEIDLGIATFSKAAGVIGGAVYGSAMMISAVVNFGRAYVFTTSPPPFVAEGIVAAIDVMRTDSARRERLERNVRLMREGLATAGLKVLPGRSPIVPILLGDEAVTLDVSQRLAAAGYLVVAVRPPTVPPGSSRLRVTVSSEHAAGEIDGLIAALRATIPKV